MQDKKASLGSELILGVTYASLMSAVSLFFTGILISQYRTFDSSIKVPIILLIISTFAFIFSATIYSNAGNEITLNKLATVEKHLIFAKNIVEVLGLYLFVFATPMVIGAVTRDSFMRTSTIVIALVGFILYSQSRFSTLEKEVSRQEKRLLSVFIFFLVLVIYLAQSSHAYGASFVYSAVSVLLILFLSALTALFCTTSKQYVPIRIRLFSSTDSERLAKIIGGNLAHSKNAVHDDETPLQKVHRLAKSDDIFVAEFNNHVVGMISLRDNKISHIFTDHTIHRKGVGRTLVQAAEEKMLGSGHNHVEVEASSADHAFYERLGFQEIRQLSGEVKRTLMRKRL